MEHRARSADSNGRLAHLETELKRHRRAEEDLRQSSERFRLLIEHGSEFVFRYLFEPRRFDYLSPGIGELCGYSAAEFYDDADLILSIVHADDRALLRDYISTGDFSRVLAIRFLHKDGTVVWVEQRSLPSYDARGRLVAIEGIARDVSGYRHVLEDLDRSTVSVEERERMITALRRIGSATLESLDLEHVLDTLSQQIVHAGIFRSLMVALVDHRNGVVRVVRNYLSFDGHYEEGLGRVRPGAQITPSPTVARREGERLVFSDQRIIGATYDLNDDNITPTVARTGVLTVIDGPDERFDERFEHDEVDVRARTTAYFVPVQRDGRVLAVLATGSDYDDREETLRRIKALEPLLAQAAIALDHAMVHGRVRDHARELHALNGRLRSEISLRLQAEDALRDFSQQTVHLAEEERRRVARELHDGVNQLLCAVGFGLEAAGQDIRPSGVGSLEQTRELLDRTIQEVRRISQDLRPGVLDDLGLVPAVRSLCETCSRRSGLPVRHDLDDVPPDLPAEIAITVYRLLQASLNQWGLSEADGIHVHIHSGSGRADAAGSIVTQITDHGGPEAALSAEVVGHLRERAGLLQGSVALDQAPDNRRLVINLPVPERDS